MILLGVLPSVAACGASRGAGGVVGGQLSCPHTRNLSLFKPLHTREHLENKEKESKAE